MPRLIALVLLVALAGCSDDPAIQVHFDQGRDRESPFPLDALIQTAALRTSDPIEDSRRAFRTRDYRLVGLSGMIIDIPGIARRADFRSAIAVKFISGTGGNPEIDKLAEQYALSYNLEMLRQLTNKK